MNLLKVFGNISLIAALVLAAGCNSMSKDSDAMATAAESSHKKPFKAMTRELSLTATVAGVNQKTRELVLKDDAGEEQTFVIGENARNLEQVSVGDVITINYLENLTIEVVDGTNMEAGAAVVAEAARAKKGEMPAGAMGQTEIEVFMVEAIDLKNNTFVLKDAAGMTKEFTANNPENLKNAVVGDAVVVSITKAVAVGVVKAK